ncbi:MAG TPA: hypothetical protein VG944_06110, partial [Fimbriimonas sp.]|nr:hypothetical protein [Fimbriimonas sp.]
TVYPCLLAYLVTGKGGTVTVWEGSTDDQYSAKSIDFALKQAFPDFDIPADRLATIRSLEGKPANEILDAIGGRVIRSDRVQPILPAESIDLLVTGGVLEHFKPRELRTFLRRSFQALRRGGWCSHVFDLRDHLYHADKSIPFQNHLRFSELAYNVRYGHPLGYHNRLLPAEIEDLIREAGFEMRAIRRRVLPQNRWATCPKDFADATSGLDRSRLAPRFATATEEDLRSVAIQFLARKPD